MNRGIYSTAGALLGAQRQLDQIANNLANVSTTGFKRDELAFGQTLQVAMRANGGNGPEIGSMSLGTASETMYTSFELGPITESGNPFDFAIQGEKGLFGVQTPQGVQYTRNGAFELSAEGMLTTREHYPVLDEHGDPIQIPVGELAVNGEGVITVNGVRAGKLGVFEGQFTKLGANLFNGANVQPVEDPNLRWKAIENSNVNAVESMVEMFQLQRRFDLAQRSITQQDELSQRLIQSLQES